MEAKPYTWQDVPREQVNELFTRQLVTGEHVMLAHLELKKGCIVPRHQHENEQLSLVYSGSIRFWLGENEEQDLILREGQVLVIPPNLPHRAEILEDFVGMDVFSPPRQDWLSGSDSYLRK